jgi:hypothetical protein
MGSRKHSSETGTSVRSSSLASKVLSPPYGGGGSHQS